MRQNHPILIGLRLETDVIPFYGESSQRVDAEGLHGERDDIDGSASVSGSNRDTAFSVRSGICRRDGLELIACFPCDLRKSGRTYRQDVVIGSHIRAEALKRHTSDEDIIQRRFVRFLRRENEFIYRLVSVSGSNRHTYRSVQHSCAQRRYSYGLELVSYRISNIRDSSSTEREVDIISEVIRLEISDITACHLQCLEV